MTHRGPFQPLLFCDSVAVTHLQGGSDLALTVLALRAFLPRSVCSRGLSPQFFLADRPPPSPGQSEGVCSRAGAWRGRVRVLQMTRATLCVRRG